MTWQHSPLKLTAGRIKCQVWRNIHVWCIMSAVYTRTTGFGVMKNWFVKTVKQFLKSQAKICSNKGFHEKNISAESNKQNQWTQELLNHLNINNYSIRPYRKHAFINKCWHNYRPRRTRDNQEEARSVCVSSACVRDPALTTSLPHVRLCEIHRRSINSNGDGRDWAGTAGAAGAVFAAEVGPEEKRD